VAASNTEPHSLTEVRHDTKSSRGAKQIGLGRVGPGLEEMFTGIGHAIVEGAKFSGENIKEFFTGRE